MKRSEHFWARIVLLAFLALIVNSWAKYHLGEELLQFLANIPLVLVGIIGAVELKENPSC